MDFLFFYNFFRFFFLISFTALHILFLLGLLLECLRDKKISQKECTDYPLVSLVIPVHNESLRIPGLLKSLAEQDYPNTQFVFIDDRSEDNTAEMILEFFKKVEGKKTLLISLKENPGVNRKQYALTQGIEKAEGDIILFTDGDCQMPPNWIRGMVKHISDEKTGLVIAPVFKKAEVNNFFYLYQCFEHGIRYIYAACFAGLGIAGGGFGNNLIFKKSCLDAIGGYSTIPYTPTEDAALISAIRSTRKFKIGAAISKDVHVTTQGEENWKKLINQNLRWNNGGLFSKHIPTNICYGFFMISIGAGILAIPVLPFIPSIWPLPLAVLSSMLAISIANLVLFKSSLPKNSIAFGFNVLFTPTYFTFLTAMSFLGIKPDWKGKEV